MVSDWFLKASVETEFLNRQLLACNPEDNLVSKIFFTSSKSIGKKEEKNSLRLI